MKQQIHPTAVIHEEATIGADCVIGPYCVIGPNVVLEENVVLKAHVYIEGHTTIGKETTIWPGAVIGAETQDLKYRGGVTFVRIGKRCRIRECVTINSSSREGTSVVIGDDCLIMAYCHIAHDCVVGNRVIMANNATLAGHVTIEDCAVIGGLSAIHQFSRVGCYAMVGGMSRVTHDVPPYTIGAGSPYKLGGLNLVGLKRHGFSLEVRTILTKAYRYVYRSGLMLNTALEKIAEELPPSKEIEHWLAFCKLSRRGLIALPKNKSHSIDTEEPISIEESSAVL